MPKFVEGLRGAVLTHATSVEHVNIRTRAVTTGDTRTNTETRVQQPQRKKSVLRYYYTPRTADRNEPPHDSVRTPTAQPTLLFVTFTSVILFVLCWDCVKEHYDFVFFARIARKFSNRVSLRNAKVSAKVVELHY